MGIAERKLRGSRGRNYRIENSLTATAAHLEELQEEEEQWKKFLEKMEGKLSSKFGLFPSDVAFATFGTYIYASFSFAESFPASDARAATAVVAVQNKIMEETAIIPADRKSVV